MTFANWFLSVTENFMHQLMPYWDEWSRGHIFKVLSDGSVCDCLSLSICSCGSTHQFHLGKTFVCSKCNLPGTDLDVFNGRGRGVQAQQIILTLFFYRRKGN